MLICLVVASHLAISDSAESGIGDWYFRQGGELSDAAAILSRNAYGAYLIHEPEVTLLAMAAAGLVWYPLLKFGLEAVVAVPLCFGLALLMRRLPYADRVL